MKVEIDPRVWEDLAREDSDAIAEFKKLVATMERVAATSKDENEFNQKMKELGLEPEPVPGDDPAREICDERLRNPIKTA